TPTLDLHLREFPFEGYAVPALDVHTSLLDEGIRIEGADAPYGGGHLVGVGMIRYDGDWDLTIKGDMGNIAHDPNVQRHARGARGHLMLALALRSRGGLIRLHGGGRLRQFAYDPIAADYVGFRVDGAVDEGIRGLSVELELRGTTIAGAPFGNGN